MQIWFCSYRLFWGASSSEKLNNKCCVSYETRRKNSQKFRNYTTFVYKSAKFYVILEKKEVVMAEIRSIVYKKSHLAMGVTIVDFD